MNSKQKYFFPFLQSPFTQMQQTWRIIRRKETLNHIFINKYVNLYVSNQIQVNKMNRKNDMNTVALIPFNYKNIVGPRYQLQYLLNIRLCSSFLLLYTKKQENKIWKKYFSIFMNLANFSFIWKRRKKIKKNYVQNAESINQVQFLLNQKTLSAVVQFFFHYNSITLWIFISAI